MEENRELNIERDPSSELATKIAQDIEGLVGTHDWSGDRPYEIQMLDSKENKGFIYQVRKGDDWITIQERVSDNPSLVRSFLLNKKGGGWIYVDGSLIKHKVSSLLMLQTAYERLRIAIEASAPGKLDTPRKELPTDTKEDSE